MVLKASGIPQAAQIAFFSATAGWFLTKLYVLELCVNISIYYFIYAKTDAHLDVNRDEDAADAGSGIAILKCRMC